MLPLEALRQMRPMFATPCYAQNTTSPYSASMFLLGADCIKAGMESRLETRSESIIHYSRNMLVAEFLADESLTHLVFIDADILFSTSAVFRLLLADKDVVAGVYPLKEFHLPPEGLPPGTTLRDWQIRSAKYPFFPVKTGPHDGHFETDEDGFCEVVFALTGLMCIKRGVFHRMIQAYPHLDFVPQHPKIGYEKFYWRFFQHLVDPLTRRELPEDFSFSKMWRDIGGKLYNDVESKLCHLGQHLFPGDLVESLEHRQAKPTLVEAA